MIALLFAALTFAASPVLGGGSAPAGSLSSGNSTVETLAGDASFTGAWEEVTGYGSITVRTYSAGAAETYAQFSADCSTQQTSFRISDNAATSNFYSLKPTAKCFRVVVTDVSSSSNAVTVQTLYHVSPPVVAGRLGATFDQYDTAINVRELSDFDWDAARGKSSGISVIHKFARNSEVGTSLEDVWDGGGDYSGWLTSAEAIQIASGGNAADDAAGAGAREIACEGLDASGLKQGPITITTAGASASSATSETWLRVYRCWVTQTGTYHGANTGAITIETATNTTVAIIPATTGQTAMSMFSCPTGSNCYVRQIVACVASAKGADVFLWHLPNADDVSAPYSGGKRLFQQVPGLSGCYVMQHQTWDQYPGVTDFWASAITETGTTADVTVEYEIIIEDPM